jgi:hypothetical protein
MDTRWVDPNHIPLSNGPMRTITGPARVQFNLGGDAQVAEFLLPFPMHIVDPQPWRMVQGALQGRPIFFEKPLVCMKGVEVDGRLGNETPDAYCTIVRIRCEFDAAKAYPPPRQLWDLLSLLLRWIRIKARHYWVLHGQTGFASAFRGSVLLQHGNQIEMNNFAEYGQSVIVRPLSQGIWNSIDSELASGTEHPASEELFCDALSSATAGEDIKAILQLGVAAEVAITRLLTDVASSSPTTREKRKFLSHGERDFFYVKLDEWPGKLGLKPAKSFTPKGVMKDWIDVVKELYRFRGAVAHSGRVQQGAAIKHIASYVFATSALLWYCRDQTEQLGVPVYSYPAGEKPFDQVLVFTDAVIDSVTSPSRSTIR